MVAVGLQVLRIKMGTPSGQNARRLVRAMFLTGLLGSVLGLPANTATAQQKSKDPEIVEAKQFDANKAIAQITVRSPKPVTGTLRCDCPDGARFSTRLELPTGGEKTVWLPLGKLTTYDTRTVVWDVPGSDDPSVPIAPVGFNATTTARPASLAALPSALGSRKAPNSVSSRGRGGSFNVAEISVDDVEQRGWILEGFGVLATTTKELNTLSTEARLSIFDWVSRGGELLIDDDDLIPMIGEQPTANRNVFVGTGVVRRTSNAIRTGQWETVLLPARNSANSAALINSGSIQYVPISLQSAVKLPPIGALLAGLLVYALATGPVAYSLGRKRNKPLLMWTAVPLASLLTTGAVLGIGIALRRTAHDQFVIFRSHGVADHVTVARAVADGSSAETIKVPNGWDATASDLKTEVGLGITSSVDLRPGQIKEIRFSGSTPSLGAPFEASIQNNSLTIKNLTGDTLTNIVGIGSDQGQVVTQEFPDVGAGASKSTPLSRNPYYFSSSNNQHDRDIAAVVSIATSNGFGLDDSFVIVVQRQRTVAPNTSALPSQLLSNAKYLRSFDAVTVISAGPREVSGSLFNGLGQPNLHRFDVGSAADEEYVLVDVGLNDKIWIGDQQVSAADGQLPEGAVQNGTVLIETQSAKLELAPGVSP